MFRQESGPLRRAAATVAGAAPEQGPFTNSRREIEDSLASTLDRSSHALLRPPPTPTPHPYNIARALSCLLLHAPYVLTHNYVIHGIPVGRAREPRAVKKKMVRFFSPSSPRQCLLYFSPLRLNTPRNPLLRLQTYETLLFGAG